MCGGIGGCKRLSGSPQPEEGPSENFLLLNFAKEVKEKGLLT